jgi:NAD-dependent SIR2 family protein deacetylase
MNDKHGPGWRPRCKECGRGMTWEECPNCKDDADPVCPTCDGTQGLWTCKCAGWMGPPGYYVGVAVYDYSQVDGPEDEP